MANSTNNKESKDYVDVYVDSDPGSGGIWTNGIGNNRGKRRRMWITVRASSDFDGTVTVQFKTNRDSSWFNYKTYTSNDAEELSMSNGIYFRIGVDDGGISAGGVTAGIHWN